MTKNILLIMSLLLVIAAAKIYFDNNFLGISQYTVTSNKIPPSFEGYKILQLSDLHSKSFGDSNSKLIKKITSENPDIIVITGDMVSADDTDFEVFTDLAKEISQQYNTYYIVGNHEQSLSMSKQKKLTDKLTEIGVKVLDNEKATITRDGESINLYGLWFNLRYYKDSSNEYTKDVFFGEEQIQTILGDLDTNSYNILLTHNPLYADTYSSWGADLTLSGHIHGGIIRIPFVGGLLSPERKFFPKYDGGMYQVGDKLLIVNRGLGNGGFGIRIFNQADISVITLKNSNNSDKNHHDLEENAIIDNLENTEESSLLPQEEIFEIVNVEGETILERFEPPQGFKRVSVEDGSFAEYLRTLSLKPHGSPILFYDGREKTRNVHEAVVNIDIGERDLLQCADAVMYLRGEYLYKSGLYDKIQFEFANGFVADYKSWMEGKRIVVEGNHAYWVQQTEYSNDFQSFRRYFDMVFAYANTVSLERQLKSVNVEDMQIGDVFMKGPLPGHCVIVVDMAENEETGEKLFMIAQSYMPAQEIHVLKNYKDPSISPWYSIDFGRVLSTPEWTFYDDQLMRYED
jgi:predicted MPP superfamily phosphohydrolase